MAVVSLCLVLTTMLWVVCSGLEERLVLHSDTDIAQEITEMKTLLARQNQSIQSLMHAMGEKDAEIAQLKTQQLAKYNVKSTYVRWGKTSCPGNGSTLVYSGYMAGGQSHHGAGSNYLCLVDKPQWNHYDNGHGYGGIRGIEYQFDSHTISEIIKFFGSDIHNADAPCAVCETSRAANIMIPGSDECNGGWTKEYSGYLVSEYPGYEHSSEFVCLDARPDTIPGSNVDDDNARLFINEVDCGSSSLCPPYVQGRELTCVICSI